jgi:hypothetical protein
MKKMSFSRWTAFLVAVALHATVCARPAFAQSRSAGDVAQARELMNQGKALREKGDLPGAVEKLKAADALIHTPITAIELGRTYALVGKLVESREAFLSIARIPVTPEETARSAAARTESEKLAEQVRPRIPSLNIRVTGVSPSDTVVFTMDGAAIPTEALAAPRLVNPGSHALVARSTAGGKAEASVDLKEGETRNVELKIVPTGAAAPAVTAAPSPPESAAPPGPDLDGSEGANVGNTQRVLGIVIGGVGLVGMGVSSALVLVAKSQYDTAVGETGSARHSDSVSAHGLADGATIGFLAGAVATAAGAVVWFTAPRAPVSVGTNGRSLFLTGSFQ